MFKVNNKDIRTTPMASCFTHVEPVTGIGLPFELYFQVFFGWSRILEYFIWFFP